jgi:hypothetical protein
MLDLIIRSASSRSAGRATRSLNFVMDATDLSRFEDRHFDANVFSANGVDYIRTVKIAPDACGRLRVS